jgi:hypothetical protein
LEEFLKLLFGEIDWDLFDFGDNEPFCDFIILLDDVFLFFLSTVDFNSYLLFLSNDFAFLSTGDLEPFWDFIFLSTVDFEPFYYFIYLSTGDFEPFRDLTFLSTGDFEPFYYLIF